MNRQIQEQLHQLQIQQHLQQPKEESLGKEMYSGAAGLGKIYALFSAILGTLISVVMIIVAINIIKNRRRLISVNGKVTKSSMDNNCLTQTDINSSRGRTRTVTTCNFDVNYQASNNQSYTKTFSSTDMFFIGDNVTVWYDPNNPNNAEYKPTSTIFGWIIIGIGVFIILGGWFWVWVTRQYKFAAAAGGVKAAVNIFR